MGTTPGRRTSKSRFQAALILLLLAAAIGYSDGQTTDPSFTISIDTPQTTLVSGSLVRLDITATNETDHLLNLRNFRPSCGWAGVTIRDSDGNVLPSTFPSGRCTGSQFSVFIHGGKSANASVNLSKIFDLSKPGKYTIETHQKDPENNAIVFSNTVTITITAAPSSQ